MEIKISNKVIGESQPCFIIAEIGMNHNGDINLAREIIKSAKDCSEQCSTVFTVLLENNPG